MDSETLLNSFKKSESLFHRFLSELKEQISSKGLGNFPFCDMPIGSLTALNWIVDALKKNQYDTTELESNISSLYAEVEQLNDEMNGAYYKKLFIYLEQLVHAYEEYFNDFQKYKNKLASSPSNYNDYVESHAEGIYFINEDEDFEFFFAKRTGIEGLLDFFKDRYNVEPIRKRVEKLDIIAKRDIWEAMKAFDIPEDHYGLRTSDIAPEKYWWLHLKKP